MVTLRFSWSEKSVDSKVSFPTSILEKSRRSLRMRSNNTADVFRSPRYSCCSEVRGGIEGKIGHADDAVHRCTDFMADIGRWWHP
jgi:hypothetical protein